MNTADAKADQLPAIFVLHACDILAGTNDGLSDDEVREPVGKSISDQLGKFTLNVDRLARPSKIFQSYDLAVVEQGYDTVHVILERNPEGDITIGLATVVPETKKETMPNTKDATRIETFDAKLMQALPIGGRRSFDSFALLLPGVVPALQTQGPDGPRISPALGTAGQFSVNGLRSRENNFTIDSTDNNDEAVGARRQGYVIPALQSIESLDSFTVLTGLYDERFGKDIAGQIDAFSVTGRAQFHGAAYGFLNDRRLTL